MSRGASRPAPRPQFRRRVLSQEDEEDATVAPPSLFDDLRSLAAGEESLQSELRSASVTSPEYQALRVRIHAANVEWAEELKRVKQVCREEYPDAQLPLEYSRTDDDLDRIINSPPPAPMKFSSATENANKNSKKTPATHMCEVCRLTFPLSQLSHQFSATLERDIYLCKDCANKEEEKKKKRKNKIEQQQQKQKKNKTKREEEKNDDEKGEEDAEADNDDSPSSSSASTSSKNKVKKEKKSNKKEEEKHAQQQEQEQEQEQIQQQKQKDHDEETTTNQEHASIYRTLTFHQLKLLCKFRGLSLSGVSSKEKSIDLLVGSDKAALELNSSSSSSSFLSSLKPKSKPKPKAKTIPSKTYNENSNNDDDDDALSSSSSSSRPARRARPTRPLMESELLSHDIIHSLFTSTSRKKR